MAHVGTSGEFAKRPAASGATGPTLLRTALAVMVAIALGIGLVAVTSVIAASKPAVGIPATDHSYDGIETLRGGVTLPATVQPLTIVTPRILPGDGGWANPEIVAPRILPGDGGWANPETGERLPAVAKRVLPGDGGWASPETVIVTPRVLPGDGGWAKP